MPPPQIGGSFAPPLDADKLASYRELASDAPAQVREAMLALADMVETFQQTPASTQRGSPHPSGRGQIVPLAQQEIERIGDVVPWDDELDAYAARFEQIDAQANKPLRDAAFHLLWFGRELARDREPMTADRLQQL